MAIIGLVTVFYVHQLNKVISENVISSISEIAEHDKAEKIYLNRQDNLYNHLSESSTSELTNEEVAQKLNNLETFSFYHTHAEDHTKELLYFIPLIDDFDMYFVMSVTNEVFLEQTTRWLRRQKNERRRNADCQGARSDDEFCEQS